MKRFKSNLVRNLKFHANEIRGMNTFTCGVMLDEKFHEYSVSSFRCAYDMLYRTLRYAGKADILNYAYIVDNRTGEILVGWYGDNNKWGC